MSKYLGIDCSIQNITAVVLDISLQKVIQTACVTYGQDLPQYNSPQGILPDDDPLIKHSDPLMWLDALELLFQRLAEGGLDFADIAGIGGSAQQHGTIYLKKGFLTDDWLKPEMHLRNCIEPLLARKSSPILLDSSTFEECHQIAKACGGNDFVRQITGSSTSERFAAPQIRRFAQTEPEKYRETAVIHLVSSFLCSILTGKSAPLDYGDASGMNLMCLKTNAWHPMLLEATAPGLEAKLPALEPSSAIAGFLHPYFKRFGFNGQIPVVLWSGDSLNSMLGVGCYKTGTAVISLGTSDTFSAAMDKVNVDPAGCGHVYANPAGGFMSHICFTNGSFAREVIRDEFRLTWKEFDNDAFSLTRVGNDGCIMLPYFTPEITPLVLNACPFYKGNSLFESHKDAASVVRALVEAQAMTMRLHSQWIGAKAKRIRVTGGASKSDGMCQVFADVFNATVERLPLEDSPSLGAAMRAAQAIGGFEWARLTKMFCSCDATLTVRPVQANVAVYDELIKRYEAFEHEITGM